MQRAWNSLNSFEKRDKVRRLTSISRLTLLESCSNQDTFELRNKPTHVWTADFQKGAKAIQYRKGSLFRKW